ncbi:hypothetical protein QJS10_CPA16g01449 [Acorus calamus]|uniref:RING-type domain-containing protein n=1 Tax=Acorus calamus TaxID=4465 RepID=A0AAV9D2P8_ACOCL|nr:hypothetical protein QJS10_CPA16g01449 [Acorus calamus]
MLMEEKEDYDLTIMSSLLSLTPTQFSHLTHSLSSELLLRRRRLHLLLSSPPLFSSALRHIDSLSLPDKSALLARLLLRSLRLLALDPLTTTPARCLRDLDAGLLLLAMCDAHGSSGAGDWRARIADHVTRAELLGPWGLGAGPWAVVGPHVDSAVKCRRLLRAANGGKAGRETAASVAAVVALPSVEGLGSEECSVCREEMGRGRSVCGLPCKHAFHWGCILPWLEKKNTCPCCRLELPSDDVFCEIGRLWRVLVRRGNSTIGSDR